MVWFSGSANSTTPVTFGSGIWDFQDKIGYNSACAGDTPQMLTPTRGFLRSADLMVSDKLCSDDPCCHGNEKLGILPENLP